MRELSSAAVGAAALEVLHEDAQLLVLVKPAGLLSVPGRGADKQDCLSARVQCVYPDALVVHRLDMATSGLFVMARGADMQRLLSRAFAERAVEKRYVAVASGQPNEDSGIIDLPIAADWPNRPLRVIDHERGKPSQTRWRLLAGTSNTPMPNNTARLELEPLTGRTHQLRLHLQAFGHPILGDALYAPPRVQALAPRLLLHASELAFAHPASGERMVFKSAPPF
jgi:tRNA pseudouridine32 synthase / 23S rRNA pseudouridine746 synthase